jgi:hypothetical protein
MNDDKTNPRTAGSQYVSEGSKETQTIFMQKQKQVI